MDVMQTIEGRTIRGGRRWVGCNQFGNYRLDRCLFEKCVIGFNSIPFSNKRDVARDCEITDCTVSHCVLGRAIVQSTIVRRLAGDMLMCWGTLFDRVRLEGKISPMLLHGRPRVGATRAESLGWRRFAAEFYKGVEWALDISDAEFVDFSIRTDAVPLNLVKRDRETQFIVSASSLSKVANIAALGLSEYASTVIELMREEGCSEALLIAPRGDPRLFDGVLKDCEMLRGLGSIS
jgi:hypothetical protein